MRAVSRHQRKIAVTIAILLAVGLASVASGGRGATRATQVLIGNSIPQGSDPSLQIQAKALKAEAKKLNMRVIAVDANLDLNKQIADVDTLVQKKAQVLAIWPMDSKAIQPALKRAKDAGVFIITQQTPAGRTATRTCRQTTSPPDSASPAISGRSRPRRQGCSDNRSISRFKASVISPRFRKGAKQAGLIVVDTQTNNNLTPEASAGFANTWKQRYGSKLKGIFSIHSTPLRSASSRCEKDRSNHSSRPMAEAIKRSTLFRRGDSPPWPTRTRSWQAVSQPGSHNEQ